MLYVIYAEDHADSTEKRQSVRTAHLARLQILQDEKRLVVAGPMPVADCDDIAHSGVAGSIVIAEFSSLEAARTWANEDPYVAAGVYQNIIIRPFKQVF